MAVKILTAISQITRFGLDWTPQLRRISTAAGPLSFRASTPLCAEPTKKRKKTDITQVIQKEAKKKRKLEKQIRKIEQKGRHLKPVEEIEGDRALKKTLHLRKRDATILTFEESERRALMFKDWQRYRKRQYIDDLEIITAAQKSQQRALNELKNESEELYKQAIQIDMNLFPFSARGPMQTPPIQGYDPPDGEYTDTTRKFDKWE